MVNVLETAIGLIFVYLILSLIVSAVNEGIVSFTGRRAKYLEKGIANLLGEGLTKGFYQHGLIDGLKNRNAIRNKMPSYISASTFSTVVRDMIGRLPLSAPADQTPAASAGAPASTPDPEVAEFRRRVETLPTQASQLMAQDVHISSKDTDRIKKLAEALGALTKDAIKLDDLKKRLETWFDETMDRVSGWYSRWTRVVLFIIGLVLVCGINADTINIVDTLWLNPSVRESVVKAATETVEQGDETASTSTTVASAIDQLEELQLPLGWAPESAENDPRRLPGEFSDWFAKLVGLVLTAVALTFGSSFWFDLLKQFVGVRSSGAPPSAPPSSGSKPEGA